MTDMQTRTSAEQQHEQSRPGAVPTRRAVLTGAGALGATCLLAACGTDTGGGSTAAPEPPAGSPAAPAGDTSGDTGGNTSGGGEVLAAVADVPEGGAVIKGNYVIAQPTAGTFVAFDKKCTHQGCPVSKVDGDTVVCTCHNSVFSVSDGSVQSGPAKAPLKEAQVKVDGDNIVAA